MDSLMSKVKSAAEGTTTTGDEKKANLGHQDQPTASEIMHSAKVVAEAAQCAANKQTNNIDKAKVAGAAADIVDATEKYGKFDETKGVGQYLKKADDYLHEYEKSGATPPPPTKEAGAPPPAEEKKGEKEESGSGFGAADAMKAAGSFFK